VLKLFQLVAQERRLSTAASRTMAAISLSFIVMVTPWSIQEVVAACTGSKVIFAQIYSLQRFFY